MSKTYTRDLRVRWGLPAPMDARASWDARAIARWGTLDIPWNRQQTTGDDALVEELLSMLNGGILAKVRQEYRELADLGEVESDVANRVPLYEDSEIKVMGDTNASHGYFYLVAWLKPLTPKPTTKPHRVGDEDSYSVELDVGESVVLKIRGGGK